LTYNGIHYFVNGGGSMTDSLVASSSADLVWAGEGYSAFASATATKNYLEISYIDASNTVQYVYSLNNSWNMDLNSTATASYPTPMPNYTTDISGGGMIHLPPRSILYVSGGFLAVGIVALVVAVFQKSKTRRNYPKLKNYLEAKIKISKTPPKNVEKLTVLTKFDFPPMIDINSDEDNTLGEENFLHAEANLSKFSSILHLLNDAEKNSGPIPSSPVFHTRTPSRYDILNDRQINQFIESSHERSQTADF
jgi:hypothetical protein